ncbi:MAG: energy transducer TonB [Schwartzia sp.]|nr:energy transducer TonB [Schwartzia sp. (in: firmicutes)]
MDYPSHWRMAYLAAFFAHLLAWLFVSLAAPHLFQAVPDFGAAQEIEWVDATELPGELPAGAQNIDAPPGEPGAIAAADAIAEETAEAASDDRPFVEQVITPEDAPELVTDEVPLPEEAAKPMVAANEKEALEKLRQVEKEGKGNGPQTVILSGGGNGGGGGRQIAENARLLKPFYPAPGTVSFGGRVSVSARIGIDGKIKDTKIMVTSGRPLVDAVAMNAAKRWVYKPATDSHGKPMECNAIIIIPFQRLPE